MSHSSTAASFDVRVAHSVRHRIGRCLAEPLHDHSHLSVARILHPRDISRVAPLYIGKANHAGISSCLFVVDYSGVDAFSSTSATNGILGYWCIHP